jgi:hypothetical protein
MSPSEGNVSCLGTNVIKWDHMLLNCDPPRMGDHSVIISYVKHMLILGTKSCYQAKLSYLLI